MTKEHVTEERENKNKYDKELQDFRDKLGESVDLEFLEDIPVGGNRKHPDMPFPYGSNITRPYNYH